MSMKIEKRHPAAAGSANGRRKVCEFFEVQLRVRREARTAMVSDQFDDVAQGLEQAAVGHAHRNCKHSACN